MTSNCSDVIYFTVISAGFSGTHDRNDRFDRDGRRGHGHLVGHRHRYPEHDRTLAQGF
jgi:hypothetical protein